MKIKKLNLALKIVFHVMVVFYVLFAVAGPMLLANKDIVNSVLGIETGFSSGGGDGSVYFDTKFNSMAEVKAESLKVIEETMAEGAVLLKNDNALPLAAGSSVNLYGFASYYSVHCGQGSGGLESNTTKTLGDRVTLYEGLTSAGLSVNGELNDWYGGKAVTTYLKNNIGDKFIGGNTQASQFVLKDAAWNELPEAKNTAANAAVVVFARNSGEAADLYMDVEMEDGQRIVNYSTASKKFSDLAAGSLGDALAITAEEKSLLAGLKELKGKGDIDKIIVLMNSASPFQCDFLESEEYGVDAAMWVGTLGTNGATAIGKLLTGEYNPSGKTSDTFWKSNAHNPVYYNAGIIPYLNDGVLTNYFSTGTYNGVTAYDNKFYVAYQEGIYNGYRYTETRYEDVLTERENAGTFDYDKAVAYPFGYGLSYSDFTYSNQNVTYNDKKDIYTVTVDVTNNSDWDGKEAVQVYLQKPYTEYDVTNHIEKSSVELVGFKKVTVPAHKSVTATVEVEGKLFAAYDSYKAKTYVVGSENADDKYLLTAAKDSHDAVNNILRYKGVEEEKIVVKAGRTAGDASLVWGKHIAFDDKTYSTNEFIESENNNFTPQYEGQTANYGVDKITNQFDGVDFKKAGLFTEEEANQTYITRNNWTGTFGKRIVLTATAALKEAQKAPAVENDDVPYPEFGEAGFYENGSYFDEIKLIYLRGLDYNDPLWETLLNRITFEEACKLLQAGLRYTGMVESVAAPSTSQQNGGLAPNHARDYSELPDQTAFRGFAEEKDAENKSQLPRVFCCNGLVASTYNIELIERIGEQTGEEAAWAGYNGIYGLGVNLHRGAYCGRDFEYYSEDGFLTGVAAGHEAVGLHKLGVFVLMKHAVLNDQEFFRAGLNVWADEQTIREVYSRAMEIAIGIDREYTPRTILGVMTGMNRMGATWTGGHGFCNTVLRAEYGMRGYVVSDYNSSRCFMSPVQGVLYGNDLPDGSTYGWRTTGVDYDGNSVRFEDYAEGYGEFAWAMRTAAKNILYTVANSNAMNGRTGDTSDVSITPAWEKAVPIVTRVFLALTIWSAAGLFAVWGYKTVTEVIAAKKSGQNGQSAQETDIKEDKDE